MKKASPFKLTNHKPEANGKVGQSFPIRDALMKVTGQLQYVDDMTVHRMLYAKVLFSKVAHARILNIDTSKAEELPGVRAVITHENISPALYNACGEDIDIFHDQKILSDQIRFVGDRIAAVAADSEAIAEKALRLIKVEYEELPLETDPRRTLEPDALPIHPDGNLLQEVVLTAGDTDAAFAAADHLYKDEYYVPPIHHGAIEPHAALAVPDSRGKVTIYTPSQDVFAVRKILCRIFDVPMSRVRVINPALGGGFGGKIDAILEPIVMALALKTGRPVKLVLKRREVIPSTRTRHEMYLTSTTSLNKDGTITGFDLDAVVNAGAYAAGTMSIVWAMGGKVFKSYRTPNLRYRARPTYTNSPIGGAMRGFGSPQRCFAQQRQLNTIAKDLGISIIDLHLKNLVTPESVDARDNTPHGNARPIDCVKQGAEEFDWQNRWEMQEAAKIEQKEGSVRRGIGMAVAVHGNGVYGVIPDTSGVIIKMNEDGTVNMLTGASDMGNGLVSTQAQFVAEILGLELDEIEVVQTDTDVTLWDLGDYSSRGTFVCGQAAIKAANSVKEEVLTYASEMLETDRKELSLTKGSVVSQNNDDSVTLAEVSQYAHSVHQTDICHAETFASNALALSYGAHFCEVEVDTENGKCEILDYLAVHDIGRPINPMNVEGQIEGAIHMGMGLALTETLDLDPATGKANNINLRKYHMPLTTEMPPIRVRIVDHPESSGPFGAKSLGECSTVPVAPAIVNAISNALDCEFNDLPVTPEKILQKLSERQI